MTNEQTQVCDELWREALSAGLVRWMPGMLISSAAYVYRVSDDTIALGMGDKDWQIEWILPVWNDPATIGCLLAMAREATEDAYLRAHWCVIGQHWSSVWFLAANDCRVANGGSEPEALLRAILATRGAR